MSANDPKDKIAEQYNVRAAEYQDKDIVEVDGELRVPESKSGYFFVKRKVLKAMSMAKATPDMKTLEVGCSIGQMTVLLAPRFKEITAVDISPDCIELNRKKFTEAGLKNIRFEIDDAEKLDTVEDESMDLVVSFSAIRYCSDVQEAVNAAYRKLKKGGTAVIDFPNRLSPWHIFLKKSAGIDVHVNDHLFDRGMLREMFEKAGFTNIRMKNLLFTPRVVPNAAHPIAKLVSNVLEYIPLVNLMSGVIMVEAHKDGGS
jgi:ubiquinone/menaquinone biosynthesis C-methylase UbiE